jgi:hypothetical protein
MARNDPELPGPRGVKPDLAILLATLADKAF